jgi:hypothetical protein
MLADPTLVEGNQGAPAGRTESQPLLAHVIADFQSICLQGNNATTSRHDMEGVVARDKHGNTMPASLSKSNRASSRKAPSRRGLSRSASVADLNPMASTLPLRMGASTTLAESRWHSSRALNDGIVDTMPCLVKSHRASNRKSLTRALTSVADFNPMASLPSVALADCRWSSSLALNDCPPKLPTEEEDSNDSSSNVGDLAPWTPRKTSQAKACFKAPLQPVPTGADKALPSKTVCRPSLADTRWISSRSLSDNAPKTPSPPRSLLGIMRDAPDNISISPPAPPMDKTPSPPRRTRQFICTSPLPSESPTSVATTPSDHNRKAMPRKGEHSESARKQEQRLYQQSAFRDEAIIGSVESEERRASLKDVLNEYAKII